MVTFFVSITPPPPPTPCVNAHAYNQHIPHRAGYIMCAYVGAFKGSRFAPLHKPSFLVRFNEYEIFLELKDFFYILWPTYTSN